MVYLRCNSQNWNKAIKFQYRINNCTNRNSTIRESLYINNGINLLEKILISDNSSFISYTMFLSVRKIV